MEGPRQTKVYAPPEQALPPLADFEGKLTLDSALASSEMIVIKDDFDLSSDPTWRLAQLPEFDFQFIGHQGSILPLLREPQRTDHPYWEWVIAPGQAWHDPSDPGWSRALIPFSLKENNQNCTHNGLMTFAYKATGEVSRVAWQIGSETCLYFKADLWGVSIARYQPGQVKGRNAVVAAQTHNAAAQLPVEEFDSIHQRFPAVEASDFQPPGIEHVTVYGFIADGVHYQSHCPTRHGPHPLCSSVDLPSYSTSKSLFAGLSYLLVIRKWPEFADALVSDWVPECQVEDERWSDVKMKHLVNMTTGNFADTGFQQDEAADVMMNFFLATTHAGKARLACEMWPRNGKPGKQAVYHTTDHYLLGAAMASYVRKKLGDDADLYRDMLYPNAFESLDLSRLTRWTQRTYDAAKQAFVGYGLLFTADDVARLGLMLTKLPDRQAAFEPEALNAALFRAHEQRASWPGSRGDAYSHGFWGVDVTGWLNCAEETWIPFMSGYGGIIIVLMPNDTVYYYVGDSNQYAFRRAVVASHQISRICE